MSVFASRKLMLTNLWKRAVCLAALGWGMATLVLACSDSRALPSSENADAGVLNCIVGTSGCYCGEPTSCREGLICVSNRCYAPEGDNGNVPDESYVPPIPGYGGDGPSLTDDAGTTPSPVDASTGVDAAPGDPPDTDAGDGDPG
jgi:hypothetical protein